MAGAVRPRNRVRWTAGALALAALVHGAVWLRSLHQLNARIEEQARALRAHGWQVVLRPAWPQGWPGRAGLQIGPASIGTEELSWHAERVSVGTPLRWPQRISGLAAGPIDARAEGQQVRLGANQPLQIDAPELRFESTEGEAVMAGSDVGVADWFQAQGLRVRFAPEGMALTARQVRLHNASAAHAPAIEALALHAALTPAVEFAGDLRSAAAAWQAAGGAVDLSELTFAVGHAKVSGQGRLWLDGALQPRFEGVLHVAGYAAGLDDLAASGVLTRQAATAAKAVLSIIAAPALDGAADVPMQIANGALVAAQFPLLRVPLLNWPVPQSEP